MRFSQRIGARPATKLAQRESIDDDLRSSLWSVVSICHWDAGRDRNGAKLVSRDHVQDTSLSNLMVALWFHYFKRPVDTIPTYWGDCLEELRAYFFRAEWFEVYDFIEFLKAEGTEKGENEFAELCNLCLERENSAYRFVKGQLTEITSELEIGAVERALDTSGPYAGVKKHLETALALMSDRKTPDYRNSIKESISAVESLAKKVAGDPAATLGAVLKELERSKALHPALKNAFSSLYGYTNDAQGIRHALLDEPTLTHADAKFMLVCCSSFVNYVVESSATQ